MELHVGAKAVLTATFTKDSVRAYADLTGDRNPLHFDESFASKTRFGNLIVQGGLTTGLLHALVSMDMPGPGTVFLNQSWQFTGPVFVGDTVTAEAEIVELHESKPVTKLKITVKRQTGEIALDGEAWCYTVSPEA